jgi:hypothetical protein
VWTLISMALWACVGWASPFWRLFAVKLLAAAALLAAALAGRGIAERLDSGGGNLALLAIGLNPLFLLEGPGNGHNDLLMLALLLIGALLCLRAGGERHAVQMGARASRPHGPSRHAGKTPALPGGGLYYAGILLLGLSVGIKFITLPIIPWLVMRRVSGRGWDGRVGVSMTTAALALGPLIAGFAFFWRGPETLAGLMHHATWGTHPAASAGGGGGPAMSILSRVGPTLLVYLGLTLWLWLRREEGLALTAWVPLAACLVFSSGAWFPWYFIWPFIVSLARWNRIHVGLSAACGVLAACLTVIYSWPFPS